MLAEEGRRLRSVAGRFGPLGTGPWVPLFQASLATRRRLGIGPAEFLALHALLLFYESSGTRPTVAHDVLACALGVARVTVTGHLGKLRQRGFVATKDDPRYGARRDDPRKKFVLRYNAAPYLVADALLRSDDIADGAKQEELRHWAYDQLDMFMIEAKDGLWDWRIGALDTRRGDPPSKLCEALISTYGLWASRR